MNGWNEPTVYGQRMRQQQVIDSASATVRKPLRERLKDRTAAQSTTATEATKKEAAMLELTALLKENPHVARILELIEELGL